MSSSDIKQINYIKELANVVALQNIDCYFS